MEGLHFQSWIPASTVKAGLVIVHGAGEHSGRYQFVKDWFLQHDVAVFAGDLPGLGRSPGKRGHVEHFSDYVEAAKGWIREAHKVLPDRPVFVLGHSMGGLVTVRLLQDMDAPNLSIHGVILSSPLLRLNMQLPPWKVKLAAVAVKLIPTLRIPNEINPAHVSRSPEVVRGYAEDPYMESRVSLQWFSELQTAMQQASVESSKIQHPILLLQAGADRLVDPEAVYPFMERISSKDKTLEVYSGLFHEIMNEPEKLQVLQDMMQWIDIRL